MTKTLQYMRKRHYTIRIRDTRVDTSGASAPRDSAIDVTEILQYM